MPFAAVVLEDVHKSFGGRPAVAGLNLQVFPGEIYGLLGANGAGKTTALRVVAGLLLPDSGSARVHGFPSGGDEAKARVGAMNAQTGLYARLSPHELLCFFGRLHHLPEDRLAERVARVTTALGLEPYLHRRCESLSTGEKQRVSIARAILHDPDVLILDEPTAGLDVLAGRFLRGFVRDERERGKAILFSTHDLGEVERLCDRVGFLHHGRLIGEGTPAELRADAVSLEEAFLQRVDSV